MTGVFSRLPRGFLALLFAFSAWINPGSIFTQAALSEPFPSLPGGIREGKGQGLNCRFRYAGLNLRGAFLQTLLFRSWPQFQPRLASWQTGAPRQKVLPVSGTRAASRQEPLNGPPQNFFDPALIPVCLSLGRRLERSSPKSKRRYEMTYENEQTSENNRERQRNPPTHVAKVRHGYGKNASYEQDRGRLGERKRRDLRQALRYANRQRIDPLRGEGERQKRRNNYPVKQNPVGQTALPGLFLIGGGGRGLALFPLICAMSCSGK